MSITIQLEIQRSADSRYDRIRMRWDRKTLGEQLRGYCGVDLDTGQCQPIFKRMGIEYRKPRAKVAQSDTAALEKLKKNN